MNEVERYVEQYGVSAGPAGADGVYIKNLYYEPFPEQTSPYTIDSLRFYVDQHGEYHYY